MEHQRSTSGLQTFLEHWGFALLVATVCLASNLLSRFNSLMDVSWIRLCVLSLLLMANGAGLVIYAKLPVYRAGRLFTFGVKSVPPALTKHYRWGWTIFWVGAALATCLIFASR